MDEQREAATIMSQDWLVVRKATDEDLPFIISNTERAFAARWPFVSSRHACKDIEGWINRLLSDKSISILVHHDHPKAIIACACHTQDKIMVLFARKELQGLGYEKILQEKLGGLKMDPCFKRLM
jgi:hypothetical protein